MNSEEQDCPTDSPDASTALPETESGADTVQNEMKGQPEERAEGEAQSKSGSDSDSASEKASEAPSKIDLLRAEARENYDKFLRASAEIENLKKRSAKERSELLKYAGEHLARDLLDVVDNMERALIASQSSSGEDFVSGVRMILEQFRQIFERHGVRGETALGGMFDPTKQEALASVPSTDKEPNMVLDEYRKTYFFKDKLLRPGQVVVAVRPPEEPQETASQEPVNEPN